jgi:hypothetical protein
MATKKTATKKTTTKKTAGSYVILRCTGAGVHAGILARRGKPDGTTYELRNARRIWRYNGAQTLSEVAVYGLSSESRIAPVVDVQEIRYDDVHEIIHCQPAGRAAIEVAKEWRA